jgi:hypothetical protein
MSSLGEAEVMVSPYTLGKIRAINILAEPAVYPRLGITLGCTLQDLAKTHTGPTPFVGYELVDLIGDIRLDSTGGIIGPVSWVGPRGTIRSAPYIHEVQLKLVCDLDPWRLERIEDHRDGKPPVLWLFLWPTFIAGGERRSGEIRPIEMRIAREMWLEFLQATRCGRFEVIEIESDEKEAGQFQRALEQTRAARSRIDIGDYDEAVALCRKALEALNRQVKEVSGGGDLERLITARADERRSKEYLGIISRIKQLAAFAVHELGASMTFSRVEAQFVVRTTESLLALIGRLLRSEQARQGKT